MSPGKGSLNLFAVKIGRRRNSVYLHVDANLLAISRLISSFEFISSANLVLKIDFNTVAGLLFPTSLGSGTNTIPIEVWPARTRPYGTTPVVVMSGA